MAIQLSFFRTQCDHQNQHAIARDVGQWSPHLVRGEIKLLIAAERGYVKETDPVRALRHSYGHNRHVKSYARAFPTTALTRPAPTSPARSGGRRQRLNSSILASMRRSRIRSRTDTFSPGGRPVAIPGPTMDVSSSRMAVERAR